MSAIGRNWGERERSPHVVPGAAEAAARHRDMLSHQFPDQVIVVGAGEAPVRSNDFYYDFRPHSDFYWLTGSNAEDAVLVMRPQSEGGHDATLYAHQPARPGDVGFFSDAQHGELWVGPMPGLPELSEGLAVAVADRRTLGDMTGALRAGAPIESTGAVPPSEALATTLSHLRMVKDEWELEQLRDAARITAEGFDAVLAAIPQAVRAGGERWLQGTFDRYARTFGNGPGYATIVGAGANAPVLHWVKCDGQLAPGDLLLLDMGVEVNSYYTADITRTVPVSGAFTPHQREVHDLVERAHRAGLEQVAPGRPFSEFFAAVMEVVASGLRDWGLLDVSVDEALSSTGQQHRRYLACGVGHHLGLDVHDCAQSTYEQYQEGVLAPGMVVTVEPGIYFHSNDLTVPPDLRGLGIRIEDDVEVTMTGSRILSSSMPIDASAIESWVTGAQ